VKDQRREEKWKKHEKAKMVSDQNKGKIISQQLKKLCCTCVLSRPVPKENFREQK
jgi:transcriptional/translational regulatory protein YebC/TACO1